MKDLKGKAAVITGGAGGIGRGAALAFARRGANVLLADINEAGLAATAEEVRGLGVTAEFCACDVGQADTFERLRDQAKARLGGCDLLMNNVGVLIGGRPQDIPLSEWERILNTNLMSVVRSQAAFLPDFVARGSGHIVNVASMAGLYPYAYDRMPYAASKAAIVAISEGLFMYLRPLGVGVTMVCPGPVSTGISRSMKTYGPPLGLRGPGPEFKAITAEEAGEMIAEAVLADRFLLLTHPEAKAYLQRRAADWDKFLIGQADEIAAAESYGGGPR
ncbi:MAG: short-chain dehydrogenase [Phenylobacterium sp.]|nr:short-chain dehydrogenase [Phenylobacterium sp.]